MNYKILHIAPHYGGGVGSVTKAWTAYDQKNFHTLTYLNNIPENKTPNHYLFNAYMVKDYDIVICHVWNHPALFSLLTSNSLTECRLIGWSHMSGLHTPYILFQELIDYFDEFYYTSPISNNCGIAKDYIWSTTNLNKFFGINRISDSKFFNIGYIGTLDFCKLHPKFSEILNKITIPDVKFTIIGDGCDLKSIKDKAKDLNIEFTGKVSDTRPYLKDFDLFLYPLNEKHFGTCEQVIGEAMASNVPCIGLKNNAEIFINGQKDGYICQNICLCESIDDLISTINNIPTKGLNINIHYAKERSKELYDLNKTVDKWNTIFDKIILTSKKNRQWEYISSNKKPFLESLGPCSQVFDRYINNYLKGNQYDLETYIIPKIKDIFKQNIYQWKSRSKGSIYQYLNYFPNDIYLKKWSQILDEMPAMQ